MAREGVDRLVHEVLGQFGGHLGRDGSGEGLAQVAQRLGGGGDYQAVEFVRGQRLTELLKQPQFSPLKTEEQVLVIYAGVNGYLDPLPVSAVRAFEDGLLRHVRESHADILDDIRSKKEITEEMGGKLKDVVAAFAKAFAP